MSEPMAGTGTFGEIGIAELSIAELERRAALAAGRALSLQDQQDWAEAFLDTADANSARLLIDSVAVRQGFSHQLETARGRAAEVRPPPAGNTVERAIGELRRFARAVAPAIAQSLTNRPPDRESASGLHPSAKLRKAALRASDLPLAELVGQLTNWLRAPAQVDLDATAQGLLDALRGAEGEATSFDARGLASAPFAAVAAGLALQSLRHFLRTSCDLLNDPLGSPLLFRAAARFDLVGLGPYFGNVQQIARRSANLFELAAIAEDAANEAGVAIGEEAWVALLSRNLRGGLQAEVLDDLGDRNAAFALRVILDRALAFPAAQIDQPLVMRIRDTALDNLDYDLAGVAQQAIVELHPGSMLERHILGTIDASGGRTAAAEQSFAMCLVQDPANESLRKQADANRMRQFEPFVLVKGFGSPRDRQLKRLQRRENEAA